MKIYVNKRTALRLLRAHRARGSHRAVRRVHLWYSSPAPGARWTRKRLEGLVGMPCSPENPLDVAAPSSAARLQMSSVRNTVYGSGALPDDAFVDLGNGIVASSPELLFVELCRSLELPDRLMLGFELCGGFSRDAEDPIGGPATMNVAPVTSCARIAAFLDSAHEVPGMGKAREALELLADNAWSPTEAVVATMAALPLEEFGYGLAPLELNRRVETPDALAFAAAAGSRVPDILFAGTTVGINYDGAVHLDLESIVDATRALERNPGEGVFARALDDAVRKVRAKVVDDIRRNRELAADGLTVFPVVKEDLYERDGLDRVMAQVVAAIEAHDGRDLSAQRRVLASRVARESRYELIRSLMPGKVPMPGARRVVGREDGGAGPEVVEVGF